MFRETNDNSTTGRKTLSVFIILVFLVGMMMGISDAYADNPVLINNEYPFFDNTATKLLVNAESGTISSVKWYKSSEKTGNYSLVGSGTQVSGSLFSSDNIALENNTWYKAVINESVETIPIMIFVKNNRNYITNGAIGYSWFSNGQRMDIIGKYKTEWINTTYSGGGWEMGTSNLSPPPAKSEDNVTASIDQLYGSFSSNNIKEISLSVDLGGNHSAFSVGCDIMLNGNDGAPLTAVLQGNVVTQIQVVDDYKKDDYGHYYMTENNEKVTVQSCHDSTNARAVPLRSERQASKEEMP